MSACAGVIGSVASQSAIGSSHEAPACSRWRAASKVVWNACTAERFHSASSGQVRPGSTGETKRGRLSLGASSVIDAAKARASPVATGHRPLA